MPISLPVQDIATQIAKLAELELDERIAAINYIRTALHGISPFKREPVDCVLWVKAEIVEGNDWNPNAVAPPEMELLRTSIRADGYTQPIVAFREGASTQVVDGFHRNRVGKECEEVRSRVHGYLPIVYINEERGDRKDRIAATIRHNRARGRHGVEQMSNIVAELAKKGWDDQKIARELGMDADEVLRLKQVTGLAELFADREFSEAWEIDDEVLFSDDSEESVEGIP